MALKVEFHQFSLGVRLKIGRGRKLNCVGGGGGGGVVMVQEGGLRAVLSHKRS